MKKVIQVLMVLGVGAGVLGAASVTASANSQYSAARSKSVRLVWRKSMKRHALMATTGARYSKHLGIRYSNNDVTPTVVWYTDAHEKLYEKNKGVNAIYYHVKSGDGTLQGWIWRGYLKTATSQKPASSTVTTQTNPADPAENLPITNENTLIQEILSLFPGTTVDQKLSSQAGSVVYTDDGEESPTVPTGETYIHLSNSSMTMDTQNYQNLLTQAGYPAAKRAQYRGWHIGVRVQTEDGYGEGVNQGDAAIFLSPAK